MKLKKKIFIITTCRADYYLLRPLLQQINRSKKLKGYFVATGSHISKKHGYTIKSIKKDFKSVKVVKLKKKSEKNTVNSMVGEGIKNFGKLLNKNNPDALMILGDRYEALSASVASIFFKVPIIHLHGGELTAGAIDENIRHAISKFSSYHFVSNEKYRRRVIQLGENPKNVFSVGSIGVENIGKCKFLSKKELEKKFNFKFCKKNFIITYHPETYDQNSGITSFKNLLSVLKDKKDTFCLFTRPNTDEGNETIAYEIKKFIKNYKNSKYVLSLGQVNYFSILKYFDGVLGNSSSGIIEAPSLRCPTINIGNRQLGRIMPKSVINCLEPNKSKLKKKLKAITSKNFLTTKNLFRNPYYKKDTSLKIVKTLEKVKFESLKIKKFFDI